MTESEVRKCRAAAALYRKQQERISQLETRIAELEGKVAAISKEDAEVIAIVRLNHRRWR